MRTCDGKPAERYALAYLEGTLPEDETETSSSTTSIARFARSASKPCAPPPMCWPASRRLTPRPCAASDSWAAGESWIGSFLPRPGPGSCCRPAGAGHFLLPSPCNAASAAISPARPAPGTPSRRCRPCSPSRLRDAGICRPRVARRTRRSLLQGRPHRLCQGGLPRRHRQAAPRALLPLRNPLPPASTLPRAS